MSARHASVRELALYCHARTWTGTFGVRLNIRGRLPALPLLLAPPPERLRSANITPNANTAITATIANELMIPANPKIKQATAATATTTTTRRQYSGSERCERTEANKRMNEGTAAPHKSNPKKAATTCTCSVQLPIHQRNQQTHPSTHILPQSLPRTCSPHPHALALPRPPSTPCSASAASLPLLRPSLALAGS